MKCPHCGKPIRAALIRADAARQASAKRVTHGAGPGRPRAALRCPCGAMTVERATKRKHVC